jgi:hypothetical protein
MRSYLSACRLTTVPAGIANLPALQVLDMSNNNFATAMENFPASLRSLYESDGVGSGGNTFF